MSELLAIVARADQGDAATDAAIAALYDELKSAARRQLRRLGRPVTLDTTALVHEAWGKFREVDPQGIVDRTHFVKLAARAMRQVLIDGARARDSAKRGGGARHVELDGVFDVAAESPVVVDELLALEEALGRIATAMPRAVQVVELHFFAGLTFPEVAEALGVSERTARGDWMYVRALLAENLR
jgi:RNA polymerase sigma factor (TIGR02999 family)